MKTSLTVVGILCAIGVAPMLRADGAENARQLAELQALSFSAARKVSVAALSAPAKKEDAGFHGCALRSEWKEIPGVAGQALASILRELIVDGIAGYAKAGDADIVWLQPLGFVYGTVAVRLETDRGRREFSVTPVEKTSYVYAYDVKQHSLCFVVEGTLQAKLVQSLPNERHIPVPANGTPADPAFAKATADKNASATPQPGAAGL